MRWHAWTERIGMPDVMRDAAHNMSCSRTPARLATSFESNATSGLENKNAMIWCVRVRVVGCMPILGPA